MRWDRLAFLGLALATWIVILVFAVMAVHLR
jgi:hypothetical protein